MAKMLKSLKDDPSTRTNLPLFGGAALGVIVVLGVYGALGRAEVGPVMLGLVALGALAGCLAGALLKRG